MLFLCGIILWAKLSSIILMWNLQSTFYDIIIALQFLIKYVRTASDFCCQTSLHCNLVVTVGAQYIDETVRPLALVQLIPTWLVDVMSVSEYGSFPIRSNLIWFLEATKLSTLVATAVSWVRSSEPSGGHNRSHSLGSQHSSKQDTFQILS